MDKEVVIYTLEKIELAVRRTAAEQSNTYGLRNAMTQLGDEITRLIKDMRNG